MRSPVSNPELFASQLLQRDVSERLSLCARLHAYPSVVALQAYAKPVARIPTLFVTAISFSLSALMSLHT